VGGAQRENREGKERAVCVCARARVGEVESLERVEGRRGERRLAAL